jgi:AcrR family transcriptional regulator
LRSVAEQLERGELSDVTVPDVARAAGVSVRTVYRHFATREELLAATAEWISGHYWRDPAIPETLDEVVKHPAANFRSFDEHPNLARAMVLSGAGGAVRSARRQRRLESQNQALRAVTSNLPARERHQAEAVFGYLSNMLAWLTMREEHGLSGRESGDAITWAMRALVEDLRRRNEAAGA